MVRPKLLLQFVLIETLWNVKFYVVYRTASDKEVLIETLWNVKLIRILRLDSALSVLIETLWNVKFIKYASFFSALSINRNIMECKVITAVIA